MKFKPHDYHAHYAHNFWLKTQTHYLAYTIQLHVVANPCNRCILPLLKSCEFDSSSWRGVMNTLFVLKFARGFFCGFPQSTYHNPPVTSTNKTDFFDGYKVLLKVALKTQIIHYIFIVSRTDNFGSFFYIAQNESDSHFPYLSTMTVAITTWQYFLPLSTFEFLIMIKK